jgi:hypothetical protein
VAPRSPDSRETPLPAGLARPALRALASAGVTRLEHLTRLTEREAAALHGMGPRALGILKAALAERGSGFAEE